MKMRHRVVLIVLVCATLLSSHPALAQFSQQGPKLVGTGNVGGGLQGYSVSISADGNTAIVGEGGDSAEGGAAWIWTRSGGVWTQQGNKLIGSDAVFSGFTGGSVSISGDGNTAIVGRSGDNNNSGAAWVWIRSGGVWTQQGPKLVGSGAVGNAQQGFSVSMSGDGNTVIVAGISDNNNAGAVWVWTRSGGVWTQQGNKIVGFYGSTSLSADGNTAILGRVGLGGRVFTRSGGVWTQQGNLFGSGAVGDAQQGYFVSVSGDGNTAIVGGYNDNSQAGAAWVWMRSGGVWTQQGSKLVGSGAVGTSWQGYSVSVSGDGNTVMVGGIGDNNWAGAAWIWKRSGGIWTQQGTKLVGSGAVGNAQQGQSVSISGDGNTAIVGGLWDSSAYGAAWVFTASAPAVHTFTTTVSPIQGGSVTGAGTYPNQTNVEVAVVASDGWYIWDLQSLQSNYYDDTFYMDILIFSTTAWDHPPTNWQSTALMDRDRTFAVTFRPIRPLIFSQPTNQVAAAGATARFSVQADGHDPLAYQYQWRKNGVNIPGADNPTLTLNFVGAADSAGYSVVVSNPHGSVTSATASLAVLTDGADGNRPAQISTPSTPPPTGRDSLVIVTHGTECQFCGDVDWVNEMASTIQQNLASRNLTNWWVLPFQWPQSAGPLPSQALLNAWILGGIKGREVAQHHWQHVHLIGHSAGARLIETLAKKIKELSPSTIVHCTFLDPYQSAFLLGLDDDYGSHADWSDCYFAEDEAGGSTSGGLVNAYNVDVSWVDPNRQVVSYGSGQAAFSSHSYLHDFYLNTVTNTDSTWCARDYGFALSKEKEGNDWVNNLVNYPENNIPLMLCGTSSAIQNPNAGVVSTLVLIANAQHALSDFGASVVGEAGFLLQSAWSALPLVKKSGGIQSLANTATNTPAWLAVGLTITNAVNFVQFDAAFTDTNAAQGLMTVYWNTNAIGMVDERVASPGLQTYRFSLPGTVTSGLYTLSFRLDSFNNSSSIAVTNVATSFVGVTQPITLGISLTNGVPMLQLTGPPGYNYLVQTSTNLVDWTLAALLANMNGTVLFVDPAVTNDSKRFYRAMLFSPIAAPPLLQAQISGNDFILSWPTSAADYVLETSTNLITANSWSAVADTPAIVNLQCLVTNQITGSARFYRLRK